MEKNKFKRYNFLLFLIFVGLILFAGQNAFTEITPNLPTLAGLSVSPLNVPTGGQVTVTATIGNNQTTVSSVYIVIESVSATDGLYYSTNITSPNSQGNWAGPIWLSPSVQGSWTIKEVKITDNIGNIRRYLRSQYGGTLSYDRNESVLNGGLLSVTSNLEDALTAVPTFTVGASNTTPELSVGSVSNNGTGSIMPGSQVKAHVVPASGSMANINYVSVIFQSNNGSIASTATATPTGDWYAYYTIPSTGPVGVWTAKVYAYTDSSGGHTGSTTQTPYSFTVGEASVSGVCGSANGQSFSASPPTTTLCSMGSVNNMSGSGPWTWTCSGSNGGTTAYCTAYKLTSITGVCGSANNTTVSAAPPTTNLCYSGSVYNFVTNTDSWTWTCSGSNGGGYENCITHKAVASVNGSCGSSYGQYFSSAPTSNLCSSGNTSNITSSDSLWNWSCVGSGEGTTATCLAYKSVNGSCGSAQTQSFYTAPSSTTANLCSTGSASSVTLATSGTLWNWTCYGSNQGSNATCTASKVAAPVNGSCGSANGQSFSASPPTTTLCSMGSVNNMSGSGPWTWTCSGSNGGTTAYCTAYKTASTSVTLSLANITNQVSIGGNLTATISGTNLTTVDSVHIKLWNMADSSKIIMLPVWTVSSGTRSNTLQIPTGTATGEWRAKIDSYVPTGSAAVTYSTTEYRTFYINPTEENIQNNTPQAITLSLESITSQVSIGGNLTATISGTNLTTVDSVHIKLWNMADSSKIIMLPVWTVSSGTRSNTLQIPTGTATGEWRAKIDSYVPTGSAAVTYSTTEYRAFNINPVVDNTQINIQQSVTLSLESITNPAYIGGDLMATISGTNLATVDSVNIKLTSVANPNATITLTVQGASGNNRSVTIKIPTGTATGEWRAKINSYTTTANQSIVYSTTEYRAFNINSQSTTPQNLQNLSLSFSPDKVDRGTHTKVTIAPQSGSSLEGINSVKIQLIDARGFSADSNNSYLIDIPITSTNQSKDILIPDATTALGQWKAKIISYSVTGSTYPIAYTASNEFYFTVQTPCKSINRSPAWSSCSTTGKRSTTIASSDPDDCTPTLEQIQSLTEECDPTQTATCAPSYSPWTQCDSNNRKSRTITYPPECVQGAVASSTIEYQKCDTTQITPLTQEQKDNNQTAITPAKPIANSAGNQSNQNSNNTSGTTTTPEVGTTTVDQNQNATTEQPAPGLDQRCKDEGLNSENDCMIYLKQMNIVSECLSVGIKTKDDCRGLLNKYGSVLKCRNLNDQQCNKFINDVLLADLIGMSTETRQDLTAVAGEQAVINPQSSIITIPGNANNPPNEISVPDLPLAPSGNSVNVTLLPSAVSVDSTASQQTLSPVVIVFDTDGDGLQDDFEKRLGTDPNKKDTDGDGVDDGTEVRNNTDPLKPNQAATTPLDGVDKALARGLPLEQPKYSTAPVNETMSAQVSNVSPDSNEIRFTGRAEPNQVVTLFIYSAMPIVVTVKADNDGNWVYDLDKTLINGKHEIYVAVNNDKGLIDEFSLPTIFGVAEAKAITIDEFIKIGDSAATQVPEKSNNMMIFYVLGGLGFIILLVGAFLYIREKATH